MLILFIADTPWIKWTGCPTVDTVIALGDLPLKMLEDRKEFNKLCVHGNHDYYETPVGWTNLMLQSRTVNKQKFAGIHGCPELNRTCRFLKFA
jgi:predicted phosphodiesterase